MYASLTHIVTLPAVPHGNTPPTTTTTTPVSGCAPAAVCPRRGLLLGARRAAPRHHPQPLGPHRRQPHSRQRVSLRHRGGVGRQLGTCMRTCCVGGYVARHVGVAASLLVCHVVATAPGWWWRTLAPASPCLGCGAPFNSAPHPGPPPPPPHPPSDRYGPDDYSNDIS
jgi:hypothetical protein